MGEYEYRVTWTTPSGYKGIPTNPVRHQRIFSSEEVATEFAGQFLQRSNNPVIETRTVGEWEDLHFDWDKAEHGEADWA